MAEHEPSIGATPEWFTSPDYFEGPEPRPLTAKTGGSSPLGSANDLSSLAPKRSLAARHLQLFSNGRCFRRSVRGRAVIVGSRRSEAICAVTAEPASVLKMTHARIAALPVEQIEKHASELFNLRSCRRVCRRVGSRRVE